MKNAQFSGKPSMHLVIINALQILRASVTKANASPAEVHQDRIDFNRFLVLGICHKLLRILEPVHYAAVYLNPGVGRIPDFNQFIPYNLE